MKVPFTAVHGSVRFSFSRYNTEADVDRIIEVFPADRGQSAPHVALLGPAAQRPAGGRGRNDQSEPAELIKTRSVSEEWSLSSSLALRVTIGHIDGA